MRPMPMERVGATHRQTNTFSSSRLYPVVAMSLALTSPVASMARFTASATWAVCCWACTAVLFSEVTVRRICSWSFWTSTEPCGETLARLTRARSTWRSCGRIACLSRG